MLWQNSEQVEGRLMQSCGKDTVYESEVAVHLGVEGAPTEAILELAVLIPRRKTRVLGIVREVDTDPAWVYLESLACIVEEVPEYLPSKISECHLENVEVKQDNK